MIGASPPFIEGYAVIRAAAQGPHRYRVQFLGDPTLKERFVHAEFQRDPRRMFAILTELRRAEADASFSDFFPDDF